MEKQSAPTPVYSQQQGGYQQQGYQQPQGGYQQAAPPPQQGGYQQQQGYVAAPPPKPGTYDQQGAAAGYGAVPQQQAGGATMGAPLLTGTQVGTPIYEDSAAPILRQKFVTQGYKDVPFAIAFVLQLLATIVVAIYNSKKYDISLNIGGDGSKGMRTAEQYMAIAFFLAMGVCLFMMGLMRVAAKMYIWAANIFCIALMAGLGLYCITRGAGLTYLAAFFFLIAAIHALWLFFARHRIPFAGVLLSYSVKTVVSNWGTFVMSFFQLGVLILYIIGFVVMVVPTLNTLQGNDGDGFNYNGNNNGKGSSSSSYAPSESYSESYTYSYGSASGSGDGNSSSGVSGKVYGFCCLFLLMWYWSIQVFTNVVHVTASGTVATWFFAGEQYMPRTPTVASAKRAMSTSFGSICFGSLLVAILKLIEAILRGFQKKGGFLACIALCLIGCIERLLEYFNVYAFTHVAIYGMSYIEAGKATWEMIKNCGWSALFNDNLVYPVLNMTCLVDSLAIGVVLGVASSSVILGILCFLIAFVVHIIMLRVVYSGIVTIFVCFAEAEDVLGTTNPQFYQEISTARAEMRQSAC